MELTVIHTTTRINHPSASNVAEDDLVVENRAALTQNRVNTQNAHLPDRKEVVLEDVQTRLKPPTVNKPLSCDVLMKTVARFTSSPHI